MTDFKEGDRVLVGDSGASDYKEEGIIELIDDTDRPYYVEFKDGSLIWERAENVELLEEDNKMSKFRIGDVVTYIGKEVALIKGKVCTVVEVTPVLRVEIDKGFYWEVQEQDLARYTDVKV